MASSAGDNYLKFYDPFLNETKYSYKTQSSDVFYSSLDFSQM
jgi:hypothetical protein